MIDIKVENASKVSGGLAALGCPYFIESLAEAQVYRGRNLWSPRET
jgi:hypothetical protein